MKCPALHPQEEKRLASIERLELNKLRSEARFTEIVKVAAHVFETPTAFISLIESDSQKFIASVGLGLGETTRDVSFCGHTILQTEPLIVSNTLEDDRFKENPFVIGQPHIRFYAGVPLLSPDGWPIGALSVIDSKTRSISSEKIEVLKILSSQITRLLELELKVLELEEMHVLLKEKAQEARALIDGVPSLIGHWSANLELLGANAFYQNYFGDFEKVKGKHVREVLGNELYEINKPYIKEVLSGKQVDFERVITKPDGSVGNVFVSFMPSIVNGKVVSFFSISTDITEVMKAEKARRELEVKLVNSERLSALGEIACGVAHEINNPLTIATCRLEILRDKLSQGQTDMNDLSSDIQKSQMALERIGKIVSGLKTYSRINVEDQFQESRLDAIISDSLVLCEDRLKKEMIKYSIQCDLSLKIKCRPSEISQVIINLLLNGVDAIQKLEDRWIKIMASQSGHEVELYIIDSGRGISAEVVNKMMDPFFTTKEVGKGTGLGLSISRNIIESHGGTFRYVVDAPNTTFKIQLPMASQTLNT